jgi:hypothetical protein
MNLLKQNRNKINYVLLGRNENATSFLLQDRLRWRYVLSSGNVRALKHILYFFVLENDGSCIDYLLPLILPHPDIFEKKINYKFIEQRMNIIREELMAASMHPNRLVRHLELGGEIDDF